MPTKKVSDAQKEGFGDFACNANGECGDPKITAQYGTGGREEATTDYDLEESCKIFTLFNPSLFNMKIHHKNKNTIKIIFEILGSELCNTGLILLDSFSSNVELNINKIHVMKSTDDFNSCEKINITDLIKDDLLKSYYTNKIRKEFNQKNIDLRNFPYFKNQLKKARFEILINKTTNSDQPQSAYTPYNTGEVNNIIVKGEVRGEANREVKGESWEKEPVAKEPGVDDRRF